MLVHVLSQALRLSPVFMQTHRLLLLYLISALEHPSVQMSRCVSQLTRYLYATDVFWRWIKPWRSWSLFFLTLPFSSYMLGLCEVLFFIDQTFVLFTVRFACGFLELVHVLNFFMNAFVWCTQRMRLRLLGRSLIESRSFIDAILVQCSVGCLSHLLCPSIVIFFCTVGDFFRLY